MEGPNTVIKNIQQALSGPLPGLTGQIEMAPQPVNGQVDRWKIPDFCREAAVLILLYPHFVNESRQTLHIALTQRREYPGVHSGQVSLPGGRREGNESLQTTALRETAEELGVFPETIKVIGKLSPLYIPPSNFCIYPFVAFKSTRPNFKPDPREVAELIEAPLDLLANPAIRKTEVWHFEQHGQRRIPFFEVFGYKVWGATAMILSEFLALLDNRL